MDWQVGGHLGDGGDNAVDTDCHDNVGSEDECRAPQGQSLTRTDEQTGSNGTAEGNHLRMARFQPPFCSLEARVEEIGGDDGGGDTFSAHGAKLAVPTRLFDDAVMVATFFGVGG